MHVHPKASIRTTALSCTYPLFRMHVHLRLAKQQIRLRCTYPLFRMHVHRWDLLSIPVVGCTYPLFRMHVHHTTTAEHKILGCTYPLFRMHVHPIRMDSCSSHVVLTHYSECMFIPIEIQKDTIALYLPTIQNACSSYKNLVKSLICCTYPLFRMHVHPWTTVSFFRRSCTYPLFRMHVHLRGQKSYERSCCTYPLFRMHVHPQISIILYNRHLLNVRALLFLLLYI